MERVKTGESELKALQERRLSRTLLPLSVMMGLTSAITSRLPGISMPEVLHRIQVQMLLVVAVVTLPVLGWSIYLLDASRDHAYGMAIGSLEQSVTIVTNSVGRALSESRGPLMVMASAPELVGRDPAACSRYLRNNASNFPGFLNIGVIDAKGAVTCSALPFDESVDLSDRAYFLRAGTTGTFAVGDYQVGRITGRPSINVAMPLYDDGDGFNGAIFAAIDLDLLTERVLNHTLPVDSRVSLVGHDGTVAVRYPDPEGLAGATLPPETFQATVGSGLVEGWSVLPDIGGSDAITAFRMASGIDPRSAPYVIATIPRSEVIAVANSQFRSGLVLIIGTAVLAAAMGLLIAQKKILRPTLSLVAASQRIAAGEKGVITGVADRRGEIGRLAAAFDEMAAQLDARLASYETLMRELDDRVQERTEKLRDANAAKDALLSTVSHELKNQLTGIRTFTYVLLKHADRFESRDRECLEHMNRSGAQMDALIADLTDFAAMDQGGLVVNLERCDLRKVIEETAHSALHVLEQKQQTLDLRIYNSELIAMADDIRIRQVLTNLLSNASKYSPAGTAIRLETDSADDRVVIKVRDRGMGISTEDQERLFQPFYRVKREETREIKGTGLGLAICRALIDAHRGTIWVQSVLGEGSTFTVTVPAYETAAP